MSKAVPKSAYFDPTEEQPIPTVKGLKPSKSVSLTNIAQKGSLA